MAGGGGGLGFEWVLTAKQTRGAEAMNATIYNLQCRGDQPFLGEKKVHGGWGGGGWQLQAVGTVASRSPHLTKKGLTYQRSLI